MKETEIEARGMTFQALAEGRSKTGTSAEGQNAKFGYIRESAREGNERNMFEAMLATQGVSPEESEPYRKALDSDEALRAVYNYYRAIPLWMRERLDPVPMPTMFIWPTGDGSRPNPEPGQGASLEISSSSRGTV